MLPNLLSLKTTLIAAGSAFALGVAVASFTAYKVHGWRVDSLQSAWKATTDKALIEIAAKERKTCDDLNAQSEAITHALKTNLDAINARYVRLLKAKPVIARCLPLTTTPSGDNGTTQPNMPAVRSGIAAEWLTDAAYNCDTNTARLIACQSALRGVYK